MRGGAEGANDPDYDTVKAEHGACGKTGFEVLIVTRHCVHCSMNSCAHLNVLERQEGRMWPATLPRGLSC